MARSYRENCEKEITPGSATPAPFRWKAARGSQVTGTRRQEELSFPVKGGAAEGEKEALAGIRLQLIGPGWVTLQHCK